MDRSVFPTLLILFRERPRALALSRQELREQLIEMCGVTIHVRDLQTLIGELQEQGLRIISESCGYWTLADNATEEELEAARHAANARRAHGEAEIADAQRIDWWIEQTARKQATQRPSNRQQVGLFA